jgi:acetyl esterase/lipase
MTVHPPFDPDLAPVLAAMRESLPATMTLARVLEMRALLASLAPADEAILARGVASIERRMIQAADGAEIELTIFQPKERSASTPGIYTIHGGGMVLGDAMTNIDVSLDWALRFQTVLVSVDYRLAPEHPDPTPVLDCYAGLEWTAKNAAELGFDAAKLIVAGGSAGGGLAAGCALMARDKGGPPLLGQLLMCPMVDDRNETVSSHQIDGDGIWDRGSNEMGWTALLGNSRGGPDVSPYAAPGRAADLSGLPPAFIDVGSAEVFRDESVNYASRIWAAGGEAELHVWSGGFHGFDFMVPDVAISRAARSAREAWVARLLSR